MKAHQDGSTQQGRAYSGCPGRLRAREAGHPVCPLVAKIRAQQEAESKKINGPLDLFVTTTKRSRFDNLKFNQGMPIWPVRQSLPLSRVTDPWLRACIKYIRPEAKLYWRHWAALEAKRLNLAMKDQVIKELKVSLFPFSLSLFSFPFSSSSISLSQLQYQ